MKKIIVSVLLVSFLGLPLAWQGARAEDSFSGIAGTVVTSVNRPSEDLEKIPAPQFINLYRSIRKVGSALWGVKKESKTEDTKLEKIATPNQISQYSNIQRKGNALWGIKKSDPFVAVTAEQSACVISAIENKDKAVIENRNQELKALTDLINNRTACQKSALASLDEQKDNLKKCASIFKSSNRELRVMTQKSQTAIWQTYKTSLAACSKDLVVIEDGDETVMSTTNAKLD
ncbi:MAG: hypothetical protein WC441_01635 [Patescibacteria group bacterium]